MTESMQLSHVELPDTVMQPRCKHVLFFGETGVGKSSVINMLVGDDTNRSRVSSGAVGCTSGSGSYDATINGQDFVLWDTVGLNENVQGSVPPLIAAQRLTELAQSLKDRLHLLVYVIRGTRFREVVRLNYDLFYRTIFDEQVPIVVVVTGLENEDPMEAWWDANQVDLHRVGLVFQDHACVTASRGPLKSGRYAYEYEYEESKERLRTLVASNCSLAPVRRQQRRRDPARFLGGSTNVRGRPLGSNGQWQHEDVGVHGNNLFKFVLLWLIKWFGSGW